MTLIATVFGAMCCLLLAIITIIAAILSRKTTPKILYSAISVVLAGIMVLLVIGVLPKSLPTFDFSSAAPVPASLTMYFANNNLSSGTTMHDDLHALRMADGSTLFLHTYLTALDTDITIDQISGGVLYTREFVNANLSSSIVLKALHPNDGSEIWQKTFPNPMYTYLIKDGVIYVVSVDSNHPASIDALRTSDGSTLWQRPLPYKGGNVVADDNGMLYLSYAGDQHFLYVLRASDGKMLWQSPPLQFDISQISIVDGIVYVTEGNVSAVQILHALRASDGTPLWQAPIAGSFTVASGSVYALTHSGAFVELRANTGMPLWLLSDVAQFTVVNGIVYITKRSGIFVALQASDGTPLWQATGEYFNVNLQHNFQVVNGIVYAIGGASSPRDSGTIYALRAGDGALLWRHSTGNVDAIDWFTVSNGMVYFSGLYTISLAALRMQDGSVQWQNTTPNAYTSYGTPIVVDGAIVVSSLEVSNHCLIDCSEGDYLNVLNAATGALCWRYKDLDSPFIADIA